MRSYLAALATAALVVAGCSADDAAEPTERPTTAAPADAVAPATTAAPATSAVTPTTGPDVPPRVLVVGDSTLLAIEWYSQFDAFGGLDLAFDAKSCRAVGVRSCDFPPPAPPNVVETVDAADGAFDVVVVMAGYDEWWTSMSESFDEAVAAARAKGATQVIWLTYVESPDYKGLSESPLTEALVKHNETLRAKVANGDYPDVALADWNVYVADHPDWLEADGIHLTIAGAAGVADFISREVAFLAGRPCPAPTTPGGPIADPCPDPVTSPRIDDVLALYR